MLKITWSEMHHSFMVTKWGWIKWMFLYFMVSGTHSLVTVHQPPVLTTALGQDVIMPCHLNLSHNDKLVNPPVLYWLYQDNTDYPKLWKPSQRYVGRVDLLNNNSYASNKSIRLKKVQWTDSGKYLCKLSITTERDKSFRRKGNETLLVVYDTMIFNVTAHNDSLLRCGVNVTRESGFVLSIFHEGRKLQPVDSAPGDAGAAPPYVTLTETISLGSKGEYECQLRLYEDLVTKCIFHYSPVARDVADAQTNVTLPRPTAVSEPSVVVRPEPWLLYVALLLVPITTLLGVITALLLIRRC